ncbi:MAG: DUF1566 domain-containing protein, partial [Nitrospiraceae bacterium]
MRRRHLKDLCEPILTLAVLALIAGQAMALGFSADAGRITTERFLILEGFNGEAVLDTSTQLIWERSPTTANSIWPNASMHCALKSVGGRKGWRLPSFYELMTLVDPSATSTPHRPVLPIGHPFRDVEASSYWSMTSLSADPTSAYAVDFLRGDVVFQTKRQLYGCWCVRGEHAAPKGHGLH